MLLFTIFSVFLCYASSSTEIVTFLNGDTDQLPACSDDEKLSKLHQSISFEVSNANNLIETASKFYSRISRNKSQWRSMLQKLVSKNFELYLIYNNLLPITESLQKIKPTESDALRDLLTSVNLIQTLFEKVPYVEIEHHLCKYFQNRAFHDLKFHPKTIGAGFGCKVEATSSETKERSTWFVKIHVYGLRLSEPDRRPDSFSFLEVFGMKVLQELGYGPIVDFLYVRSDLMYIISKDLGSGADDDSYYMDMDEIRKANTVGDTESSKIFQLSNEQKILYDEYINITHTIARIIGFVDLVEMDVHGKFNANYENYGVIINKTTGKWTELKILDFLHAYLWRITPELWNERSVQIDHSQDDSCGLKLIEASNDVDICPKLSSSFEKSANDSKCFRLDKVDLSRKCSRSVIPFFHKEDKSENKNDDHIKQDQNEKNQTTSSCPRFIKKLFPWMCKSEEDEEEASAFDYHKIFEGVRKSISDTLKLIDDLKENSPTLFKDQRLMDDVYKFKSYANLYQ